MRLYKRPMTIDPRNPPYNADGTGATDATAALNVAISAAVNTTDIDISYGSFLVAGTLIVNGPLAMHGSNEHRSTLLVPDPTVDLMHLTTPAPVHLEKFTIRSQTKGGQTAGAMIKSVQAAGVGNTESTFRTIRMIGAYDGFDLTGCSWWKMIDCYVNGFANRAVVVANPARVDAGDSVIDRLTSLKSEHGGTHVWQASSGGLRVQNSKMIGADYGYQLDLAAGAGTSTLLINGNSMEGQRLSGIYMDHEPGSTFENVVINGNEFESQNTPIEIASKDNVVWCRCIAISGNSIYLAPTGGIAMQINGAAFGSVTGNAIFQNGGTTYGVYLDTQANDWHAGPNEMTGITNPYVDLGVGNIITL